MLQHRPILLAEDVLAHVNARFRIDANDVCIVGGVMDLAEPEAVRDDGLSLGMPVRKNVGCIEQLDVLEPTDAALFSIRNEDHSSELLLMKPLEHGACCVFTACRRPDHVHALRGREYLV